MPPPPHLWKLGFHAVLETENIIWSFFGEKNQQDWNYHIRGKNTDGDQIRIVISFDEDGMPIITVINLDEEQNEQ